MVGSAGGPDRRVDYTPDEASPPRLLKVRGAHVPVGAAYPGTACRREEGGRVLEDGEVGFGGALVVGALYQIASIKNPVRLDGKDLET